ncbi:MAG: universal stress protein [Planctomycetes bacterium]|nr:universal stress protein [Planctomycetota bacterium]
MFDKILLVLDGGRGWPDAAEFAIEMARGGKSQLIGAAVVDTDTLSRLLAQGIFVEEERASYEKQLEADAGRYLNHAQKLADKAGVALEKTVLKGLIHKVVLQEARVRKVDALVMASWRRSMLKRDLVPHERQFILDEAECTVIVVKSMAET